MNEYKFKVGDRVVDGDGDYGYVTEVPDHPDDAYRVRYDSAGLGEVMAGPAEYLTLVGSETVRDDEPDMVNHPPHYRGHPKGIECIDVIEDNPFVNLAQSQKYVWRVSWGSKGNDIQDLEKAVWYLQREISRRNGQDA